MSESRSYLINFLPLISIFRFSRALAESRLLGLLLPNVIVLHLDLSSESWLSCVQSTMPIGSFLCILLAAGKYIVLFGTISAESILFISYVVTTISWESYLLEPGSLGLSSVWTQGEAFASFFDWCALELHDLDDNEVFCCGLGWSVAGMGGLSEMYMMPWDSPYGEWSPPAEESTSRPSVCALE